MHFTNNTESNMTGVTCGAWIAYPFGANPVFSGVRVAWCSLFI